MFQYTIQPGDTLYSIADKFGVPANAILAANPGLYPYNLIVGQIINIPTDNYTYPVYPAYPQYPIIVPFPTPFRRYPGRPGGFRPGRPGGFRPGRPGGFRPGGPGMHR